MPEQIRELIGENGPILIIRSTDTAEIHRLAVEWATDDGMRVCDKPEDIQVGSLRAIPWCPVDCGCERNRTHYTVADQGSRGSFRAAIVELYYPEDVEEGPHG